MEELQKLKTEFDLDFQKEINNELFKIVHK